MKFSYIKHKREFQGIRNCTSKEFIGISVSIIQWGKKIMPPRTCILYIRSIEGRGGEFFLQQTFFIWKLNYDGDLPPSPPFLVRCKQSKWKYGFKQEKNLKLMVYLDLYFFGSQDYLNQSAPPLKRCFLACVVERGYAFHIHKYPQT